MKNWLKLAALVLSVTLSPVMLAQDTTPEASDPSACEPTVYELPGDFVFPEGIAYQESTNTFYVSSAGSGAIYQATFGDADSVEFFSEPGADGRVGSLGLAVDDKGRLFVAGSRTGQIYVYDTESGELLAQFDTLSATGIEGTEDGFMHNITDAALAPNGDVYFTDAFLPYLYRVFENEAGELEMEVFLDFTENEQVVYDTPVRLDQIRSMDDNVSNFNVNAMFATSDGQYLLIGQTNVGKLFRISLEDKSIMPIDFGDTLIRADHIEEEDGLLYINAINLEDPEAAPVNVLLVEMAEDYTSGEVVGSYTNDLFKFQTALALIGDCMLAANAQLDAFFGQAELPFTVVSVPRPMAED